MFLNNSIINTGICNGSIGIILATNDDNSVKVAFPTENGIQEVDVNKISTNFYVNGARGIRQQYPLANASNSTQNARSNSAFHLSRT